ncbi:MAG: glycosyltransferase family 2 protein [Pseudomonadota bacterium]
MATPISVVIPLAPGEEAWKELLPQLVLPKGSEIILAAGEQEINVSDEPVRIVTSAPGRAQQMNAAAREADAEIFWFLHADSKLGEKAVEKLICCVGENPDTLWFFDLRFSDDGPKAMKWNEWAVKWRAGVLKVPFGDQGFCISRKLFFELGGYREDIAYGEDHVFVWKVRQEGYPVERIGADIFTSARRYETNGWFSTTLSFVSRTIWQAIPQQAELLRRQIGRLFS